MTELETKLSQILEEKQNKIIPENIKKGIQIFDIEGTYEGNSGDVKLFETQEEMQQDPNANEGDLAVVYREEIQNMTADSQTQFLTFPETVTLPEAFTSIVNGMLRAVDESVIFNGNIQLDQNMFRFDGFTNTGMIRVSYTSSDGITYTREEFMGDSGDLTNPVDLGTIVKYEPMEPWNDALGYFMQVGGKVFEGLFNYIQYIDPGIYLPDYSTLEYVSGSDTLTITTGSTILSPENVSKIIEPIKKAEFLEYSIVYDGVNNYYIMPYITNNTDASGVYYDTSTSKLYFLSIFNKDVSSIFEVPAAVYVVNNDYSLTSTIKLTDLSEIIYKTTSSSYTTTYYKVGELSLTNKTFYVHVKINNNEISITNDNINYNSGIGENITSARNNSIDTTHPKGFKYFNAPNQLTAISENIYNSTAYSKDGLIEGTLTQNVSNSFADINAEIYAKIQLVYDNTEPRILTDDDKEIDTNIYTIPTKSDGTSLLDTSQVTNMNTMFLGCNNLITIPLLDTSKVTSMSTMFRGCSNIQTIPLLNTSLVTDMNTMFRGCSIIQTIPQLDTSKVTDMSYMFYDCTNLTTIPLLNTSKVIKMSNMFENCSNLTTIPELDTSLVTNMRRMFYSCKSLTTIPSLNANKVTDMSYMFENCTNLSDDSFNNVLASLLTATSYTSTKTLKYIGLSEEQATKCTTLSNWATCEEAGWTTGY